MQVICASQFSFTKAINSSMVPGAETQAYNVGTPLPSPRRPSPPPPHNKQLSINTKLVSYTFCYNKYLANNS